MMERLWQGYFLPCHFPTQPSANVFSSLNQTKQKTHQNCFKTRLLGKKTGEVFHYVSHAIPPNKLNIN